MGRVPLSPVIPCEGGQVEQLVNKLQYIVQFVADFCGGFFAHARCLGLVQQKVLVNSTECFQCMGRVATVYVCASLFIGRELDQKKRVLLQFTQGRLLLSLGVFAGID